MNSKFSKFAAAATLVSVALVLSTNTTYVFAAKDVAGASNSSSDKSNKVSDDAFADQMKQFATAIQGAIASLATKFQNNGDTDKLIGELPAKDKVIETKDVQHFREYSGISEILLFNNKITEAETLRSWVVANSGKVLGADDPYPAVIDSDFGLFYYDKGELPKAEKLLKESMPRLESHMVSKPDEVRNNLISVYAGLAEIAFSRGNKSEARRYVDRIGKIAPSQ